MTIDDINHIFATQLSFPNKQDLYFVLIEDGHKIAQRHPSNELNTLLLLLDNFVYDGTRGGMPFFTK